MSRETLLTRLKTLAGTDLVGLYDKSPTRVYADIRPDVLPRVAHWLFGEVGARFNIASGVDARHRFEVLYHFTVEDIDLVISLRVCVSKEHPSIPSLAKEFPATNWIEREINELLGIEFPGHPEMKRLLLSDDWPEGSYPLRQDYEEWDTAAVRNRGA